MPSFVSRVTQHGPLRSSWALPVALFVSSFISYLGTSTKHSLLTSAIAWFSICTYATLRSGRKSLLDPAPAQKIAWAAGTLLALAQVCERAADGREIWWAKALTSLAVYTASRAGIFVAETSNGASEPASPEKPQHTTTASASSTTLLILATSAIIALYISVGSDTSIALGLSYAIVGALALSFAQRARTEAQTTRANAGSVIYSANGLLSQPNKPAETNNDAVLALLRDASAAAALCTAIAALSMESWSFGDLAHQSLVGQVLGQGWTLKQSFRFVLYGLGMVPVHMMMKTALLLMVTSQGPFLASLAPLFAAVGAQLVFSFSSSRLWFACLCAGSAFLFLDEQDAMSGTRRRVRVSKIFTLVSVLSFVVYAVLCLGQPFTTPRFSTRFSHNADAFGYDTAPEPLAPLQFASNQVHPVDQLIRDAERDWTLKLSSQSKSLEEAVTEYKRRYGMHPPPNFNRWYEFAKSKGVKLIDEYDTIYHSLLPFWALSPATIRARVREALGFDGNNLIGLLLRDGNVAHVAGGSEWQQEATIGMMKQFVRYLPDMDLAFNIHDEPRVVVPNDELSRLVHLALSENVPKAFKQSTPKNTFSARPNDLGKGRRIDEMKTTRFNVFAHQHTWIPSRLSCPTDSPARALVEELARDNLTAYSAGQLGFVYNHTAFSDICNSPSLATSHGFFDRPNAFNVVHDLFPIFSQSKMSSFQDILYPSPWYWASKVSYDKERDLDWEAKESRLWWRGSTTGGFSRDGGWRRQHRQQFVRKVNALDKAMIMQDSHTDDRATKPEWAVKEVQRQKYKDIMDVHFSSVGQCDPGDCDAQREFFNVVDAVDMQEAWKYKYLLDIDGNAFSGRFYAFLKSHSLTFKMAVFREWHEEWIKPWVHYIPLSLRGDEALESVRYFAAEDEGKQQAVRMAEAGREWATAALRNEDFEVWFFRLLLEYGRLVDDNRESIGYSGS